MIGMNSFDKLSMLHSSAQSKVYSAVTVKEGQAYVLKMLRRKTAAGDRMQRELDLHREISHDHVVHLKTSFPHLERGVDYTVLVLEFCSGGSLDQAIPSQRVDLVGRVGWLVDAARGLEHLHSKKVVHQDVKPENVMLARGRAKLGDLGLAKFLQGGEEKGEGKGEGEARRLGTIWYNAPEVFEGDVIGSEADVWSFGIMALEVILNRRISTLLEGQASPARREDFPTADLLERIHDEKLRSLVKKMLSRRREKRPKMETVVEKLEKRLGGLRKACETEEVQLELPLEEPEKGEPTAEELHRLDPHKEKAKVEKYKLKTVKGEDAVVKYDDYRETLRVDFQGMQITYDYARLPAALKAHFRGLAELNTALKTANTKASFSTRGALVFPFKARLPYDSTRTLSQSMSKSDRSYLTIKSNREEEEEEPKKLIEEPIIEKEKEEEEGSSMGEKLSNKSGSKSGSGGGKSYRFGEKKRQDDEYKEHGKGEEIEEPKPHSPANTPPKPPVASTPNPPNPPNPPRPPIPPTQSTNNPTNPSARPVPSPSPQVIQPTPTPIMEDPAEEDRTASSRSRSGFLFPPPSAYERQQRGQQLPQKPQQPQPQQQQPQQLVPTGRPSGFARQPGRPSFQQHPRQSPPRQSPPRGRYRSPPRAGRVDASTIRDLQSQINVLLQIQGPQRILLPDHFVTLGEMHYRNRDFQRSEESLRKAIGHYREVHLFYSDKCAKAHYFIGKMHLHPEGREEEIREEGREEDREEQEGVVEERPLKEREQSALHELQTAVNILSVVTSYDFAVLSKVYTLLGKIYLGAGSLILAEDYFLNALRTIRDPSGRREKSLALKPTLLLARTYLRWRNYSDARPYFEQVLELYPKTENSISELMVRAELQKCCMGMRDYSHALENLERQLVLAQVVAGNEALGGAGGRVMELVRAGLGQCVDVLLEEQVPDLRRLLGEARRLLKEYFPDEDVRVARVSSKLESMPNLY